MSNRFMESEWTSTNTTTEHDMTCIERTQALAWGPHSEILEKQGQGHLGKGELALAFPAEAPAPAPVSCHRVEELPLFEESP